MTRGAALRLTHAVAAVLLAACGSGGSDEAPKGTVEERAPIAGR